MQAEVPSYYHPLRDRGAGRFWDPNGRPARRSFLARAGRQAPVRSPPPPPPYEESPTHSSSTTNLLAQSMVNLNLDHEDMYNEMSSTRSICEAEGIGYASQEEINDMLKIGSRSSRIERCLSADDPLLKIYGPKDSEHLPAPDSKPRAESSSYTSDLFLPPIGDLATSRARLYSRKPAFLSSVPNARTSRSQSASTSRHSFESHLSFPVSSQSSPRSKNSSPGTESVFSDLDSLMSSKRSLYKRYNAKTSPSISSDGRSRRSSINTLVELNAESEAPTIPELPAPEPSPTLQASPARESAQPQRLSANAEYGDTRFNTLPGEPFPIDPASEYIELPVSTQPEIISVVVQDASPITTADSEPTLAPERDNLLVIEEFVDAQTTIEEEPQASHDTEAERSDSPQHEFLSTSTAESVQQPDSSSGTISTTFTSSIQQPVSADYNVLTRSFSQPRKPVPSRIEPIPAILAEPEQSVLLPPVPSRIEPIPAILPEPEQPVLLPPITPDPDLLPWFAQYHIARERQGL